MSIESRTIPGGSFSDSRYLGNPSIPSNRQFASAGASEAASGNIADEAPGPDADVYMVPSFMGMSGQPNNQSTDRPKGST